MSIKSSFVPISTIQKSRRWKADYHLTATADLTKSIFKVARLGDLGLEIFNGVEVRSYTSDGTPYIRVGDVDSDKGITLDKVKKINIDAFTIPEKSVLRANDVVTVRSGSIGKSAMVTKDMDGYISSADLIRMRVSDLTISPEYLWTFLTINLGVRQLHYLTTGHVIPKITQHSLSSVEIPLPPRPIQDRIAQVMQDAYATRRAKLAEAKELLQSIDSYILQETGLSLEDVQDTKHFIVPISQLAGSRFDVGPAANTFNVQGYSEVDWITLDLAADFPTTTRIPSKTPDAEFKFVGMTDVDDLYAEVHYHHLLGSEINANKVLFQVGDVVFARIEPCIYNRKIALIPPEVNQGLGSTELLVARAKPDFDPAFLLWILRSELVQRQISGRMTGTTGRRRLPHPAFAKLQIPKISFEEQQRIAQEANQRRDEAKCLRAEAEAVVAEAKARVERMILGEEAP